MTTETHNKMDTSHEYYTEQVKPGIEAYILQFLFEIQDQAQKKKNVWQQKPAQQWLLLKKGSAEREEAQGNL